MLWNYRDLNGNALSGQIANTFNSIFGKKKKKTLVVANIGLVFKWHHA